MGDLADITAVILAGGFGTRLRPVLSDRPKVLAEINGRPFLTYLLEQAAGAGVSRAVICTGYMAEMVEQALGTSHGRVELCYSREMTPLGTAGALRLALPMIQSDTVLVLNGDSYCQADLGAFRSFHEGKGAAGSLVLTRVDDTSRYGQVRVDEGQRITQFIEKSAAGAAQAGLINAGIYLLSRALLASVPADKAVSIEREIFPSLLAGGTLFGWAGGGRFIDIGTPQTLSEAPTFFKSIG